MDKMFERFQATNGTINAINHTCVPALSGFIPSKSQSMENERAEQQTKLKGLFSEALEPDINVGEQKQREARRQASGVKVISPRSNHLSLASYITTMDMGRFQRILNVRWSRLTQHSFLPPLDSVARKLPSDETGPKIDHRPG